MAWDESHRIGRGTGLQHVLDRTAKAPRIERLEQHPHARQSLHPGSALTPVLLTRDHEYWNPVRLRVFPQSSDERIPAHAWHPEVADHQIDSVGREARESS